MLYISVILWNCFVLTSHIFCGLIQFVLHHCGRGQAHASPAEPWANYGALRGGCVGLTSVQPVVATVILRGYRNIYYLGHNGFHNFHWLSHIDNDYKCLMYCPTSVLCLHLWGSQHEGWCDFFLYTYCLSLSSSPLLFQFGRSVPLCLFFSQHKSSYQSYGMMHNYWLQVRHHPITLFS